MAYSAKKVNNFFKKIVNFFYCIFSSTIDRINKIFNLIIKSIYHVQHAYIKTHFETKVNTKNNFFLFFFRFVSHW